MGKYVYALVIAAMVVLIGMVMFPSIKDIIGFNSTTGFPDLLESLYTGLPYALAFFIGYAGWKASRNR